MYWLRFVHEGVEYPGYLDGDRVKAVSGNVFTGQCCETGLAVPLAQIKLAVPCRPTKIIGVGLNYKDHAAEMKMELPLEPILFFKPPSSLLANGEPIVLPAGVKRTDYEAELAVVIGKPARRVPAARALEYVFGYTCGNDVTARDLQKTDQQWTRAKSFDTFCPLGPWIASGIDATDLEIALEVNGKLKQRSRTSQLVFGVAELVAYISSIMTLEAGDVIMTGTPSGVGPLLVGDVVTVRITGVGELTNTVAPS